MVRMAPSGENCEPTWESREVKRGQASALEFSWFAKQFPRKKLTVINTKSFATNYVDGIDLETFMSGT